MRDAFGFKDTDIFLLDPWGFLVLAYPARKVLSPHTSPIVPTYLIV